MSKSNLFLAAIFGIFISIEARDGIIDGIPVLGLQQFPHHVTIQTTEYSGYQHYCSGSILNANWVLTSNRCVFNGAYYELIFNRTNVNDSESNSFSIKIGDKSLVFVHPADDVALIRLPLRLDFSKYIKNVLVEPNAKLNLTDRFAVMPGIANGTLELSYGEFEIISPKECTRVYGGLYNETTQICTQGFRNNNNVPCWNNEGGGLLINWPYQPSLVGIFSTPLSCLSRIPAIYMRLSAYMPWIYSILREN